MGIKRTRQRSMGQRTLLRLTKWLLVIGLLFFLAACTEDVVEEPEPVETPEEEVAEEQEFAGPVPAFETVPDLEVSASPLNITAQWEKNYLNILYNFGNMYQAEVHYEPDDEEWPYKMWFFGWAAADCNPGFPGCDATFHARSLDMHNWEVYAGEGQWDRTMTPSKWTPVLAPSDTWYDSWHAGDPTIVRKDGIYYMAYSSYAFDKDMKPSWESGDKDGDISVVMGAVSEDGINWTRTDGPILVWEPEIGKNELAAWEGEGNFYGNYHRPSIMFEDGKWRIWFDYWAGPDGLSVGYAENKGDFMNPSEWEVLYADDQPLLAQWPNPEVIKVDGVYYMYGDPIVVIYGASREEVPASGWPARQLAEAVSLDGMNWVFSGWIEPDPDTPANQIPQAMVLDDEDGHPWIYVWYATQRGGDPTYDYRYNNIRYMKRPVDTDAVKQFIERGGHLAEDFEFADVEESSALGIAIQELSKRGPVFPGAQELEADRLLSSDDWQALLATMYPEANVDTQSDTVNLEQMYLDLADVLGFSAGAGELPSSVQTFGQADRGKLGSLFAAGVLSAELEDWNAIQLELVSASSQTTFTGMEPKNVLDENLETFWSSNIVTEDGRVEAITLENVTLQNIGAIQLHPRIVEGRPSGFPRDFEIQISEDGKAFEPLPLLTYHRYLAASEAQILVVEPAVNPKYIRISASGFNPDPHGNYFFQIAGVEMGGGAWTHDLKAPATRADAILALHRALIRKH